MRPAVLPGFLPAGLRFAMTPTAMATEIQAPGPLGPLAGTLLRAPAQGPVVLVVPGSGPTDRDGNSPLGVRASTCRLLAEGLAARGISTVRIDKRGLFASAGAVRDANAVTIAGEAADIRGLVLAASPGRPLGAILREQFAANPANAPVLGEALAAISALEAGRRPDVARMHPALRRVFGPKVQDFLLDAVAIDPARLIAANAKPILIVQGERDLQVSVADAERLKAASPQAELVLLPQANHVLKAVGAADDRAANLATYGDPGLPLAPGAVRLSIAGDGKDAFVGAGDALRSSRKHLSGASEAKASARKPEREPDRRPPCNCAGSPLGGLVTAKPRRPFVSPQIIVG